MTSKRVSTPKGKKLLPGEKSFLTQQALFQKGTKTIYNVETDFTLEAPFNILDDILKKRYFSGKMRLVLCVKIVWYAEE